MAAGAVAIRPYAVGDAPALHAAALESLREMASWMPWCHDGYTLAQAEEWIAGQLTAFKERTAFEFVIVDENGRFLGGCGLNQIDAANRRANLGYWVRSSAAGRGVATAAVRELVRWARDHTDLRRLEIVVAAANLASIRVAEKSGAFREGTLRSRLLLHDHFHDAAVFSLVLER